MLKRSPASSYGITAVCRALGATPRAIRYYEQCGLVSCPRNGPKRIYSAEVFQQLRLIVQARRANLSIRQIQHLMDIAPVDRRTAAMLEMIEDRAARLDTERAQLASLIADLRTPSRALSASPT